MGCMTMSTAQQVLKDHTAFLVTWLGHQLRLGEDRKPCLELNDQVIPKSNRELLISESHCNAFRSQGQRLENIGGLFFFLTKHLGSFFQLCQALCFPASFPPEWLIDIYRGSRNRTDLEKNLKACLLFRITYLLVVKLWQMPETIADQRY